MAKKRTKYAALLRGVNVSGQKIIRMEDLKKAFESLKFINVSTYIQSGNVIFETAAVKSDIIGREIETCLLKKFGHQIVVIVRTIPELEEVVRRNPYAKTRLKENEKLHVTFLLEQPTGPNVALLGGLKSPTDEIIPMRKEVYILCRKGYGKTLFSNTVIEKKLGVPATTRNWNTVNKLFGIAHAEE